jgi:hypothetical protein
MDEYIDIFQAAVTEIKTAWIAIAGERRGDGGVLEFG